MSEHEYQPAQVYAVCEYMLRHDGMDERCLKCPMREFSEKHGETIRGCVYEAQEIINVVETGNPWRKNEPWPVKDNP